MYRIMQATSGYYYVQKFSQLNGWKRSSPFYRTRRQCREWFEDVSDIALRSSGIRRSAVVEYL